MSTSTKRPVVIDTKLTKNQVMLLSFWQHISRKTFYFFALTCAAITFYIVLSGTFHLFFVGWIPLVLYLIFGIIGAVRISSIKDHPSYLPTRYELNEDGIIISNKRASSELSWDQFLGWRTMIDCYVLLLPGDSIIAIPRSSIPNRYVGEVKQMLVRHIEGKRDKQEKGKGKDEKDEKQKAKTS